MKISVVTSLYNSFNYIDEFYSRVTSVLETITLDYEVVFVNDASPDESLKKALNIYKLKDSKLKIIDLSINSGQHKALMTGLKYSKGDVVFMMDSDMEEDPSLIKKFWDIYINSTEEVDVVYGKQLIRKGQFFERISGNIFYKLFNILSPIKTPKNPVPFRLMTRRYVDSLIEFQEREVFFLGISLLAGYNQIAVEIDKKSNSPTNYNLKKKINQFVNAITSFSSKPLIYIFYSGFFISTFSFIYLMYTLLKFFIWGIGVEGWTSLIVSIWLVGGVVIFCLGIIGIYLSKIYSEVKNRPYTIIKKIYE